MSDDGARTSSLPGATFARAIDVDGGVVGVHSEMHDRLRGCSNLCHGTDTVVAGRTRG